MAILNFIKSRIAEPQEREHYAEGFAAGYAEGFKTGYTTGCAKGITEGRAQANQQWSAWNRRRLDAKTRGQAFDEPTPAEAEAPAQSRNGLTPNQGEQTSG